MCHSRCTKDVAFSCDVRAQLLAYAQHASEPPRDVMSPITEEPTSPRPRRKTSLQSGRSIAPLRSFPSNLSSSSNAAAGSSGASPPLSRRPSSVLVDGKDPYLPKEDPVVPEPIRPRRSFKSMTSSSPSSRPFPVPVIPPLSFQTPPTAPAEGTLRRLLRSSLDSSFRAVRPPTQVKTKVPNRTSLAADEADFAAGLGLGDSAKARVPGLRRLASRVRL